MDLKLWHSRKNVKHLEQGGPLNSTSMDSARIGKALKAIREKRGYTLRDASGLSGMSYSMISMMEAGKAGDLKLGTLERVANAIGATVNIEVTIEGAPSQISLPSGLEKEAAQLLRYLPDADAEDVAIAIRWLERSAARRQQQAAG